MECKKCEYCITLPHDQIERDPETNDARKYSCSKHYFEKITEKELKEKEKEKRFCLSKNENKIAFYSSIISLIVTIFFGLFGVVPLLLEERLSREDVIDIIESYKIEKSNKPIEKTDSI